MKPKILIQPDLFTEDESTICDTCHYAGKYFDVEKIREDWIAHDEYPSYGLFRASLGFARLRMNKKYEFANALKFAPVFRHEMVSHLFNFTDMQDLLENARWFPHFIRPVSPFKEFSGNVYSYDSFKKEANFWKTNKNGDPYIICMVSDIKKISREWRCIFINGKYVSGSQYMANGELYISPVVPEKVIKYAKEIAANDYFTNIFDFVIDIGEVDGKLKLIEVNAFETSSFYMADLDLIYKTLAESHND